MYSTSELLVIITIIGACTLGLRAIFLFYLPKLAENHYIQRGMDAVPASMLVALVLPFTLFLDQELVILREEVYAIVASVPFIYLTKKYSYGLIIAIILYILFSIFL